MLRGTSALAISCLSISVSLFPRTGSTGAAGVPPKKVQSGAMPPRDKILTGQEQAGIVREIYRLTFLS